MLTEPLGRRRKVSVRVTKTALDLAEEVKTFARYRLRRCRSGGPDVGQLEYPHPRLLVQSISTPGSAASARPLGDSLHP